MRREPGKGEEVNGEAKEANNRDRRKFCTAGDRNAKEEKQELSLGIAGNKPIAQEVAQTGPEEKRKKIPSAPTPNLL